MTAAATASPERVGFIGLGNMGGAIALRLLRAGYPLTIVDLDADKMAGLIKEGATPAAALSKVKTGILFLSISAAPPSKRRLESPIRCASAASKCSTPR